ncbi:sensor histidine kinase [Allisonella histaminiformans]|uniref:HAMP domain-containing sensor histidine kinase n=1 Tax=Allisonella histaminiformans TaxID=209880 RepID=UPI0022DF2050|nr:HAMP domain-containing sensor histidine kinase [Allisonella histaminiformans]
MNLRLRLIISHVVMFFMPILTILIIGTIFLASAMFLVRGQNHLHLETMSKCSYAAEITSHILLHGDVSSPKNDPAEWLISILSPQQNLIVLTRKSTPVYIYGNRSYLPEIQTFPPDSQWQNPGSQSTGQYFHTLNNTFYFVKKSTRHGTPYYCYFIAHNVTRGYNPGDEKVDRLFEKTITAIYIALLLLILFISWILSSFMMRRIIPPLRQLEKGAREIQKGNLDVHLVHTHQDEYTPVFSAFNLMTRKMKETLDNRKKEEEHRKELIASISHDLRTPLTVIKAYAESMRDGVVHTEEKRQRYLGAICHRVDDIIRMTSQLFEISRLDLGYTCIEKEIFSLPDTILSFVTENYQSFAQQGLTLKTSLCDKDILVEGNRLLISRILMNAATNSLKYKQKAEGTLSITLTSQNGRVILICTDDGPGVPAETLPRLFEIFYRTDKARSHTTNGSGLGMSIMQKAVQLMHGTIWAENSSPHGLSIVITFPCFIPKETCNNEKDSDN